MWAVCASMACSARISRPSVRVCVCVCVCAMSGLNGFYRENSSQLFSTEKVYMTVIQKTTHNTTAK